MTSLMVTCYKPLCIGHDTIFHFRRFKTLIENLDNPYLIYLDYSALDGYGYFLKAIYSDFILIPFALIARITNIEFGHQSMIFVMTVLCGIFTYKMINRIYNNSYAAFTGAILFTFCVYRLLDVYHRAALGEVFSFTFLPLVIWGLYEIIKGDYKNKWYIFSIGYSLQILSHVLSTILLSITILIIILIYHKSIKNEIKRLYYLIFSGLFCFFLCSYYFFPLLEQITSIDFYYQYKQIIAVAEDTKLKLNWIIWGLFSGVMHPRQIFIPGTGILLTAVVCVRLFVNEKSDKLKSVDIGVMIGLIYIFLSSSLFPWTYFPFNKLNLMIQFPWRLFEFTSFFFAVAGGYYLSRSLKTKKQLVVGALLIISTTVLIIVNDAKLYEDIRCGEQSVHTYKNTYEIGGQELLPNKIPSLEYISTRKNTIKKKYSTTSINDYKKEEKKISFNASITENEKLELPLIYYKGYIATLNNTQIPVYESDNGLVEIEIKSNGFVEVYYKATIIQKIGFFITIISILFIIYIAVSRRIINNKNRCSTDL